MTEKSELSAILSGIEEVKIEKLILSNKREKIGEILKKVIRRVRIKGQDVLQCESFTGKQAFHSVVEEGELCAFLSGELTCRFRQLDGFMTDRQFSVKLSKKNRVLYTEKKLGKEEPAPEKVLSQNREKNYILEKGTYVPALFELGVMTEDGKIKNSGFDKFRQINRFVELVDDAVKDYDGDILNVIDFGCGKSYLTFVLYHYLTKIRGIKAHIVGLDLKADVIEKCNRTAEKYGYDGLHFFCGDIKDYKADFRPDMVITLHACDTATDYALYNAAEWGAKYIFSVPCCQHEINKTLKTDSLSALTDYGLIKERFSALLTDTVRVKLLEALGYKVDVLEFIDMVHSPKNLMIRAVKARTSEKKRREAREKIEELKKCFDFDQTLYSLLSAGKSDDQ